MADAERDRRYNGGRLCEFSPETLAPGETQERGINLFKIERYGHASRPMSPWDNYDILHCLDGKARRTQSGLHPLAHGVPARMGKLRAYGNAIVPQVAAQFVRAFLDTEEGVCPCGNG